MKVFIVQPSVSYRNLFNNLGFEIVDDVKNAQIVCFTGGEDVSPSLYDQLPHYTTSFNPKRDEEEVALFKYLLNRGIPMVGICRGAQLLHVLNGGSLYQDVDGHALFGTHPAEDLITGARVEVTSTHHQMMRAGAGQVVCATSQSSYKQYLDEDGEVRTEEGVDLEVVWHDKTKCLCFQPHPELKGADSTYFYFKNLLGRFLGENNAS